MSILADSFRATGLLAEHRTTWTRARATTTGADPGTGAPITTVSTATVSGYHHWLSAIEAQDFRGDTSAVLLTTPGLLMPGDVITHAILGRFTVLEEGPQPQGIFDRVPLRRA